MSGDVSYHRLRTSRLNSKLVMAIVVLPEIVLFARREYTHSSLSCLSPLYRPARVNTFLPRQGMSLFR